MSDGHEPVAGHEHRHVTPPSQSATLRYIPGLDGIRGLAVLAVVIDHTGVGLLPGGYVGVDVFFVLSGFLITRILVRRFRKENRVPFRHFYERRARRILPALWTMFLVLTGVALVDRTFSAPAEFYHSMAIAAAFLTQWQIKLDDLPGPFIHLWSLGWEENFYLLWPLVFAAFARKARVALAILLGGGIVTLTVLRITGRLWGIPGPFPIEVAAYFRVDAIMLGCLLGLLLAQDAEPPGRLWRRAEEWLGFVALLGLLIMFAFATEPFYRLGGFSLVSLSTAIMVNHLRRRSGSLLAKLLETKFIRWTGLISYGLYLWHYPVYHWFWKHDHTAWTKLLVGAPLAFGIAAISYYTVEAWFRKP